MVCQAKIIRQGPIGTRWHFFAPKSDDNGIVYSSLKRPYRPRIRIPQASASQSHHRSGCSYRIQKESLVCFHHSVLFCEFIDHNAKLAHRYRLAPATKIPTGKSENWGINVRRMRVKAKGRRGDRDQAKSELCSAIRFPPRWIRLFPG